MAAALVALLVPAGAAGRTVRFEVITPTLIRAEYAADGHFEDRPTVTATRRWKRTTPFTTSVRGGWRTIRTSRVRLRYRLGSGPFGAGNLRLSFGRATVTPAPGHSEGALGGWTRALDNLQGPVALNDGILSRDGWHVVDDTPTALLTRGWYALRPSHAGGYQDWYVFAYGHDYARGLRDLRTLTGAAPLLPRSAFGVWFSHYHAYSADELKALVGDFRAHGVPLDTLSLDTDYKAPPAGEPVAGTVASGDPGGSYSWNGWAWNTKLFPDPRGFVAWAHAQGIGIATNIHPTIDSNDPRYPGVVAQAGPTTPDNGMCLVQQADPTGTCQTLDWTSRRQLRAYLSLHDFTENAGVDFHWLDWCCDGPQKQLPGLTMDTWINSRYAARQRARGQRWPAFARIGATWMPGAENDGDRLVPNLGDGALAEHRSTVQFTGDTCATWPMLAFEAQLSAAEASIGLPYVSHDIGSFNGTPIDGYCAGIPANLLSGHLPDDLYARWVQFGTFQPLDRLHSNHGDRLPWQYGSAANAAATAALRLREALVPYTYTLARRAHDTGLPITGPLYLRWPEQDAAYTHPAEYTFGPDMVVAPVTAPGDPAPVTYWVPPGTWIDFFTGERLRGPREVTAQVPLSRLPVLVRAGAVIPTAPDTLTVYPGRRGALRLYDDAGTGFAYEHGASAVTPIRHRGRTLTIGPARGHFAGQPARRAWTVRFLGGRTVKTGLRSIRRALVVRRP